MLHPFFSQFSKDAIKQQYAANAAGLKQMYDKAVKTGKKVNNYTAEELLAKYNQYLALSK